MYFGHESLSFCEYLEMYLGLRVVFGNILIIAMVFI